MSLYHIDLYTICVLVKYVNYSTLTYYLSPTDFKSNLRGRSKSNYTNCMTVKYANFMSNNITKPSPINVISLPL